MYEGTLMTKGYSQEGDSVSKNMKEGRQRHAQETISNEIRHEQRVQLGREWEVR